MKATVQNRILIAIISSNVNILKVESVFPFSDEASQAHWNKIKIKLHIDLWKAKEIVAYNRLKIWKQFRPLSRDRGGWCISTLWGCSGWTRCHSKQHLTVENMCYLRVEIQDVKSFSFQLVDAQDESCSLLWLKTRLSIFSLRSTEKKDDKATKSGKMFYPTNLSSATYSVTHFVVFLEMGYFKVNGFQWLNQRKRQKAW